MNTEYLVVNDSGNWKAIECVTAHLPKIDAESLKALIEEPELAVDV
jgi:hypothetical protein